MPGKIEIAKDVLQVAVEYGAERVGRVTGVVTGAVAEITGEVGGWFTDIFEMLDAAEKADEDSPKSDD